MLNRFKYKEERITDPRNIKAIQDAIRKMDERQQKEQEDKAK